MFKADDRVRETSTTTGTGTYTLAGAPTGFQAFSSLGANNYCPYFATDDTNWESGIGRYVSGPDRLERTHIWASSNSDAAVNWSGTTIKLRCGLPAVMAFPRKQSKDVAGSGTVVLTQAEQRCSILELTGILTGNRIVEVDADTPWEWTIINNTTGFFTLTVRATGQTGLEFYQGRSTKAIHTGTDITKAMDDPAPGTSEDFNGSALMPGRLLQDGSNITRSTYPALTQKLLKTATITFTNATERVNWTAHGLAAGDIFKFYTTGAAPTGLTASVAGGATTNYFVINPTANDFQVAATEGGSAVTFSTDGTGTHTGIHAPAGDGNGTTTVTLPDSRRRATVGKGGTATSQLGARVGATGGAETRTIATANLPASGLSIPSLSVSASGSCAIQGYSGGGTPSNAAAITGADAGGSGSITGSASVSGSTGTGTTGNMGTATALDQMQPSLVVTRTIRT
jgi:microcystin-dependent protein